MVEARFFDGGERKKGEAKSLLDSMIDPLMGISSLREEDELRDFVKVPSGDWLAGCKGPVGV